jgi:hypothetical protein
MRHRVGLDEKLVTRESLLPGPAVGKAMRLVGGRHEGLACVVREMRPPAEGSSGESINQLHVFLARGGDQRGGPLSKHQRCIISEKYTHDNSKLVPDVEWLSSDGDAAAWGGQQR